MAGRQRSVRAVVMAPGGRLLLQQARDPLEPGQPPFWFLPGGRIDGGESPSEALRRELLEECGLQDLQPQALLWEQHSAFRFAGIDFDSAEQVFLVRAPVAVDIRPTALGLLEVSSFLDARWWPLDEIGTTSDVICPLDLVDRLRASGLLGARGTG